MNARSSSPYLRSALIGSVGVTLGGLAGVILISLLLESRFLGWVAGLVPDDQPLVSLYIGLIGAYLCIALGAGLGMLLGGLALYRIDPRGSRKRYLLGSGFAFGLAEGLLVIPILLALAMTALYTNGVIGERNRYGLLFFVFGLLFGIVAGVWLALITVRLRRSWRVALAAVVGFALGGGLMGIVLRSIGLQTFTGLGFIGNLMALLLMALALYAPAGALLGLAYASNARARDARGSAAVEPGRGQTWVAVGIGIAGLLVLMALSNSIIDFLTVRPGSTASQLAPATLGVAWFEPEMLVSGAGLAGEAPALAANSAGQTATTWVQDADVYLRLSDGAPINVSRSAADAHNPQVALDSAGRAHVVWSESNAEPGATSILYARCGGTTCDAPQVLSDLNAVDCAASAGDLYDYPAIASDAGDTLMVMWAGRDLLPYLTWTSGQEPDPAQASCVPIASQQAATASLQPRLAGGAPGQFAAVYEAGGMVQTLTFNSGAWSQPLTLAAGSSADVFIDREGGQHFAWCDSAGRVVGYQALGETTEQIAFPACQNRPRLAQDSEGLMHLVWYADKVRNITGVEKPASLIYESIRTHAGWSEPAIVAMTEAAVEPALATQPAGSLYLAWQDGTGQSAGLQLARQAPYGCSADDLTSTEAALLDAIASGQFYAEGFQTPFCGNSYLSMIFTPNPDPAFSNVPPTENGGFDYVAQLNRLNQYELSFSTMQWEPDVSNLSPGTTFAAAVAAAYQSLKANPERYPRGLHVRMLLGNYPVVASLEWGSQIWDVMSDLREAGLPEMVNPELGWELEVANYAGVFPHSHTKFIVLDGRDLLAAGFNYGYLHFPKDHPSGKGADLVDLGLLASGPVAQTSLAAYDDMWEGATQLVCTDLIAENWQDSCEFQTASVKHSPEVMKYSLATEDDFAVSLYRNASFKEADTAVAAAMESAEETIDIMHANFSLKLICSLAVLNKDICDFGDALEWMVALADAIERNHIKVRVMVETSNMNGMENRIAINILQQELARRGLSDSLEVRFFPGRVHAKSMLIDDSVLFIGSQNFHYSAWGPGGLNEFSLATNDPRAISTYSDLFDFYWAQANTPEEEPWRMAD